MHPAWHQTYYVFGQGLPVSAAIAAIPILILLYLLGVRRKAAWVAALSALCFTLVMATTAYRMPISLTASAAAYGAAFGLFPICWIVFWAIALYRVSVESGGFDVIQGSIANLTGDWRLQTLLIAFAFEAFVEGAAGFGAPVAVAAAMLVGLGFSPFYASALCLLSNTSPVAFGSIGIPLITLAGITGLPLNKLSGAVGSLCAPVSLLLPAYLIVTTAGWQSMWEVWPAVLVVGGVFSTGQFLMSNYVGPQLTDILSSIAAMLSLILLLQFWRPRSHAGALNPIAAPVPQANEVTGTVLDGAESRAANPSAPLRPISLQPGGQALLRAWMPYGLLVICVLLWGFKPIQAILNSTTIRFAWPLLHNAVQRMPPVVAVPSNYEALYNLNWLAAAGTSCMIATLLTVLGLGMSPARFARLLVAVCRQLFLPVVTVASVLSIAFVMNYCGATSTLGLAFAGTGALFPFFSPFLGWLGVFLTGSDTAANALFGNLQVVTAHHLGLDPVLIAAANSAGGVMGKMISLQTIAVAAAATGISVAEQAKLLRFTLRHSILLAAIIGLEVVLCVYVF